MIADIILVKNYDIFSGLIRFFTKSKYNHVGLFVDNNNIVEATLGGVNIVSIKKYKKAEIYGKLEYAIYRVNLTEEEKIKIADFAKNQIGSGYDIIQFICMSISYCFKKLRKLEPIDITEMWVCSELVAESFYEVGKKFKDDVDPDNITPKDIYTSDIVREI